MSLTPAAATADPPPLAHFLTTAAPVVAALVAVGLLVFVARRLHVQVALRGLLRLLAAGLVLARRAASRTLEFRRPDRLRWPHPRRIRRPHPLRLRRPHPLRLRWPHPLRLR